MGRYIKSLNSLNKLDIAKEIKLYLTKYLKGELSIPFFDEVKKQLYVYRINPKYDKLGVKTFPAEEIIYVDIHGPFSYVIGIGNPLYPKQMLEDKDMAISPTRINDLYTPLNLALMGRRDIKGDKITIRAEVWREIEKFNTCESFFKTVEEYQIVNSIANEFWVHYFVHDERFHSDFNSLQIQDWASDVPIRTISKLEERVNKIVVAAHTISEYFDKLEKTACEKGKRLAQEAKKRYLKK